LLAAPLLEESTRPPASGASACPNGGSGGADEQDGELRLVEDGLGDTPEHQLVQAAPGMRRHRNTVGIDLLRGRDDLLGRMSAADRRVCADAAALEALRDAR